jgi:hypothetical protein
VRRIFLFSARIQCYIAPCLSRQVRALNLQACLIGSECCVPGPSTFNDRLSSQKPPDERKIIYVANIMIISVHTLIYSEDAGVSARRARFIGRFAVPAPKYLSSGPMSCLVSATVSHTKTSEIAAASAEIHRSLFPHNSARWRRPRKSLRPTRLVSVRGRHAATQLFLSHNSAR